MLNIVSYLGYSVIFGMMISIWAYGADGILPDLMVAGNSSVADFVLPVSSLDAGNKSLFVLELVVRKSTNASPG